MKKPGRRRGSKATFLSYGAALAAITGSVCPAEGHAPPRPEAPALPRPSAFDLRHRLGFQLGGPNIFLAIYRYRVLGPFQVEAGVMGANHAALLSGGLVVGTPVGGRWFPYVGAGGGFANAFGAAGSDTIRFWHARAGLGFAFGAERRHMVSIDVGGWYGAHEERERDSAGNWTERSRPFTTPMMGVGYLVAL